MERIEYLPRLITVSIDNQKLLVELNQVNAHVTGD